MGDVLLAFLLLSMIALIVGWGPEAITRVALDLVGREQQVLYVCPGGSAGKFHGTDGLY